MDEQQLDKIIKRGVYIQRDAPLKLKRFVADRDEEQYRRYMPEALKADTAERGTVWVPWLCDPLVVWTEGEGGD